MNETETIPRNLQSRGRSFWVKPSCDNKIAGKTFVKVFNIFG